jgi:hypothetical protein
LLRRKDRQFGAEIFAIGNSGSGARLYGGAVGW